MSEFLRSINWQAVAAVATFAAVLVALLPIWREARRRKSQARSLRLRVSSKLTILRPSLGSVVRGGRASHPDAVLSAEGFRETVRAVAGMMQESFVLETDEQDQLGVVLANLECAAPLYGSNEFRSDSAKNLLDLIDRAVEIMSKHGLLKGQVDKPWDD